MIDKTQTLDGQFDFDATAFLQTAHFLHAMKRNFDFDNGPANAIDFDACLMRDSFYGFFDMCNGEQLHDVPSSVLRDFCVSASMRENAGRAGEGAAEWGGGSTLGREIFKPIKVEPLISDFRT